MDRREPDETSRAAASMSPDRLREILEAYGASPDRWPLEERDAALALLETSAEARAERHRAARLDALLDRAPAEQPSPALVARILAGAPRRGLRKAADPAPLPAGGRRGGRALDGTRSRARRFVAAALPLAAAATLVFWLTRPLNLPDRRSAQLTIEELGDYETPMDVLLDPPVFDLVGTVPSLGCTDSGLGCPELELPTGGVESRGIAARRTYA